MECFIKMNLLPTVITNSFQIQNQTFEKHFHFHFFANFMIMKFIPFLETLARFIMTKVSKTQVHSFHANADIKAKFTFFKKCIHK